MDVKKSKTGTDLFVEITGRIDSVTAPQLHEILTDSIDGIKSLVLDFAKVDYVSSAGLRVLLNTLKLMNKAGGSMVVRHPHQDVMDVFVMTGFDNILTIEE